MTTETIATAASDRRSKAPFTPVPIHYRLEGGAIAVLAAVGFIHAGFAWWWLLVFFLAFDLSAIGYVANNRIGALGYNLVHNYVAPAVLTASYVILLMAAVNIGPLAFIAGCWFFHVGIDRAIGYGPRPVAAADAR